MLRVDLAKRCADISCIEQISDEITNKWMINGERQRVLEKGNSFSHILSNRKQDLVAIFYSSLITSNL
jgi:hypothetical protein